jgi:hypothetical protein
MQFAGEVQADSMLCLPHPFIKPKLKKITKTKKTSKISLLGNPNTSQIVV